MNDPKQLMGIKTEKYKNPVRVCARVALAFLTLALLAVSTAQAQTYTVRVTQSGGQRLAGVEIWGNSRFNAIFGRVTNASGEFTFDTKSLSSPNPELVFVKGTPPKTQLGSGFRFEPSSLVASEATCPGRICSVTAFQDASEAAVLHWFVKDASGKGIPGIPVTAPQADYPCPKLTDANGYVIWAVRRQPAACSDSDSDPGNNSYVVVPSEPTGKRCSFRATSGSARYQACMYGVNEKSSVFTASCSDVGPSDPVSSVSYQIRVIDNAESPVAGVRFEGSGGISGLASKVTDGLGRWNFTTADVGAPASSAFNLVPVGAYQFEPSELSLSPNSCPQNICYIRAFKNGQESSAMMINVAVPSGEPVSGVKVAAPALQICPRNLQRETDNAGQTLFPTLRVPSCSDADADPRNNFIAFSPELAGCTFTDNSGMPFQGCPIDSLNISNFTAHCAAPPPHHYYLSGTVFNSAGRGEAGVGIYNNGIRAGFTDAYGNYSLVVDAGSSSLISTALKVSPFSQRFTNISANNAGINFVVDAPTATPTPVPPPTGDQNGYVNISGLITNAQGMPLAGVEIYDGDDEWSHKDLVAVTDTEGRYSFSAATSDISHWVTARSPDDSDDETFPRYFQPGGYFFTDLEADQANTDFVESDTNLALVGTVLDANGSPIAGAIITISRNSGTDIESTQSDADGWYSLSVQGGDDYILTAAKAGLTFLPEAYSEAEATQPRDGMIFIGVPGASPTPSNSPTPRPTNSPPPPATPLPTARPTAAPTLSTPAPTAAPTSAPSSIPTAWPTQNPTAAPTAAWPTPTAAPTGQQTQAPTAQPSAQPTGGQTAWPTTWPTSAPTQIATTWPSSWPTWAPTSNPTGAGTPLPSAWPTGNPTFIPTGMPTEYPTGVSTPAPSAWPTNGPTLAPTEQPTAAPTEQPSQWPTPGATLEARAVLQSVCSDDPTAMLRWSVTNPLNRDLLISWVVYGDWQSGLLYVPANTQGVFYTSTVPNSPNAVIIYAEGVQHDVKSAIFQRCDGSTPVPTPTLMPGQPSLSPSPSPTPGFNPPGEETPLPTPMESAWPSPTPRQPLALTPLCSDVQDGSTRWSIFNPNGAALAVRAAGVSDEENFVLRGQETYEFYIQSAGSGPQSIELWVEGSLEQTGSNSLGSCFGAPSPTPSAFGTVQGKLMGQNGRPMNRASTNLLKKIPQGAILAVARSMDGSTWSTSLSDPFSFQLDVPVGVYDISILSDCVKINSASKIIRVRITEVGKKSVNFSGKALGARINRGSCSIKNPSDPWVIE